MRRFLGLLALGFLTGSIGCASLAGLIESYIGDDDQPSAPVCVVQYEKMGPSTWLGYDGCGNLWMRYQIGAEPECFITNDDTTQMLKIPCPVEGDTLGG